MTNNTIIVWKIDEKSIENCNISETICAKNMGRSSKDKRDVYYRLAKEKSLQSTKRKYSFDYFLLDVKNWFLPSN